MILSEIQSLLACSVFAGQDELQRDIKFGCASDLMSDVLVFSQSGSVLLTGLVNVQTIQTAYIADVEAVVIVRGKKPDGTVIAFAHEKHIPLLGTPYSMYEACGILYRAGIPSTLKCTPGVTMTERAQQT